MPWDRVLHLATLDHIGQVRGVSEFASVITRLEDIKDYEESERVAAKIAAMLTAYVKRGSPEVYDPETAPSPGTRQIAFKPGMVIDDLAIGEEIGLIDSKRPNPNLITFRQGQLRAIAAGVGASYSSLSRDYNGTYSAQRQELVEQFFKALPLNATTFMILTQLLIFILGWPLEWTEIIVIFVPIFLPLLDDFGIVFRLHCQTTTRPSPASSSSVMTSRTVAIARRLETPPATASRTRASSGGGQWAHDGRRGRSRDASTSSQGGSRQA